MQQASGERLVMTTVSTPEQAAVLARELVENNLAACATCLPGATSYFRWKSNTVSVEPEVVLLIKTHSDRLTALEDYFRRQHPYDCPELVVLEISELASAYAQWLRQELHLAPSSPTKDQ